MDISELSPQERIVDILHPGTGEPLGIKVTLLSLLDERMKRIKRRLTDSRLVLDQKGKKFKASDIEENENALLFEAMTAWVWEGDATWKGEKPEFNRKNVTEVLTSPKHEWFKNQLMEAVSDEQSFFSS